MHDLSEKNILLITSNRGTEQDELKVPAQRLAEAGANVVIAAPETGEVQTLVGDWDLGETWPAARRLDEVSAAGYDLLLVPGGTLNADALRLDEQALALARAFADAAKPIAAICHAPWLLVEAGLLNGKTLTSYASVKTDVVNAGGSWRDVEVFRCPANGWPLITSRNPGDLDAFVQAIADELAG